MHVMVIELLVYNNVWLGTTDEVDNVAAFCNTAEKARHISVASTACVVA